MRRFEGTNTALIAIDAVIFVPKANNVRKLKFARTPAAAENAFSTRREGCFNRLCEAFRERLKAGKSQNNVLHPQNPRLGIGFAPLLRGGF